MFLGRPDGKFLPVEDSYGRSSFHIGLLKDIWKVLNLPGATGGNERDGNIVFYDVNRPNIKAVAGAVHINADRLIDSKVCRYL